MEVAPCWPWEEVQVSLLSARACLETSWRTIWMNINLSAQITLRRQTPARADNQDRVQPMHRAHLSGGDQRQRHHSFYEMYSMYEGDRLPLLSPALFPCQEVRRALHINDTSARITLLHLISGCSTTLILAILTLYMYVYLKYRGSRHQSV